MHTVHKEFVVISVKLINFQTCKSDRLNQVEHAFHTSSINATDLHRYEQKAYSFRYYFSFWMSYDFSCCIQHHLFS